MSKRRVINRHTFIHYSLTFAEIAIKNLLGLAIWFIIGIVGHEIYDRKISPYNIIFGLPLMLAGGGMMINSLFSVLISLVSPRYNRGICRWCN